MSITKTLDAVQFKINRANCGGFAGSLALPWSANFMGGDVNQGGQVLVSIGRRSGHGSFVELLKESKAALVFAAVDVHKHSGLDAGEGKFPPSEEVECICH